MCVCWVGGTNQHKVSEARVIFISNWETSMSLVSLPELDNPPLQADIFIRQWTAIYIIEGTGELILIKSAGLYYLRTGLVNTA